MLGIVVAAVTTSALIMLGAYAGIRKTVAAPVFAPDTVINGISIGGLSREEGERLVLSAENMRLAAITLPIAYGGAQWDFTAQELGLMTDAGVRLEEAYRRDKGGALGEDFDSAHRPYSATTELVLDEAGLRRTLGAFLGEHDIPAQDATARFDAAARSFLYTAEKEGRSADLEAVAAAVKKKVRSGDRSLLILDGSYIQTLYPKHTREELERNTVLIGSCTTLATKNESRNTNIALMCTYVDGVSILPGETLSINSLVGERTEEKGFRSAPSIIDGQLIDSIGGGICQLAGTLYNAALYADMEIAERKHHTWPSEYLPVGLDATLNWNDKDLKIRNRSDYPVYISATFKDLVLTVEIYGRPPADGTEIEIESVIKKETKPPDPVLIYTDELPNGVRRTTIPARKGYDVVVYRHYLKNGMVVGNELISQDHFRAMRGTILVGTDTVIK